MKKALFPLALATAIFTTGCKDSNSIIDDSNTDANGHEAISFSMNEGQGVPTRGFKAEGLTRAGFDGTYGENSGENTQILMHIESQKGTESKWRFTKTQATAAPESGSVGYSIVSFPEVYRRYWDDAHGRNSLLSVYAVAIPNRSSLSSSTAADNAIIEEGDLTSAATGEWGADLATAPTHTIKWTVSKSQTSATLYTEDLVYSNNIQADETLGKDGLYWFDYSNNTWTPGTAEAHTPTGESTHGNGRMQFRLSNTSDPASAGKFDKGHLKFNHALSRITINLVEGEGFNHSTDKSDFKFTDATNKTVNLYAMNYGGTLDIKAGTWSNTTAITSTDPLRIASGDHNSTSSTSGGTTTYTSGYKCSAQVLPDYQFNNSSTVNVLDFTIDDNTYYIENKMLWKALNDNAGALNDGKNGLDASATSYTMLQGKNYVFTITVDKKKIESVTATVADWSNVAAANENINNAHVDFTTYVENGTGKTKVTSDLHLFRLPEVLTDINTSTAPDATAYSGAYTDEATASYASDKWSTNWFFENNKTAYHFRALNNVACYGTSGSSHQSNFTSDKKAFNMYNGAITSNDYHWGAPFTTADGTKYYEYNVADDEGFKALLHKGITSTKSTINITQLHMMSQINVIVRTTDKYNNGTSDVAASNSVLLENSSNQCEVTLTRLYNHGTVDMGTGFISIDKATNTTGITNGIKANEPMTKPATGITSNDEAEASRITIDGTKYTTKQTGVYTFNVIPQALKRGSATDTDEDFYVGITIKTPDNNQYYVVKRLSEILATSISGTPSQNQTSGSATDKITYWYPNHKYIYTFTITKKGIEAITCTIADWTTVTAGNTNINLEN